MLLGLPLSCSHLLLPHLVGMLPSLHKLTRVPQRHHALKLSLRTCHLTATGTQTAPLYETFGHAAGLLCLPGGRPRIGF